MARRALGGGRQVDAKGRLVLPPPFHGAVVVLEVVDGNTIVVRRATARVRRVGDSVLVAEKPVENKGAF